METNSYLFRANETLDIVEFQENAYTKEWPALNPCACLNNFDIYLEIYQPFGSYDANTKLPPKSSF